MSQSFTRKLLYVLLSAVEEDLREILVHRGAAEYDAKTILGEFYDRALLRFEKEEEAETPTLERLLWYTDFGDLVQLVNRHRGNILPPFGEYCREITPALERLIAIRNRVAHSRPLEFDDLPVTRDTVDSFLGRREIAWANLRETVRKLDADSSSLLQFEIPILWDQQEDVKHNLPIPDFDETGFVGRRQSLRQVIAACLGPFPVVTIVGEGGVGKTALAVKAAYDLLDLPNCPFETVVWTSSKTSALGTQEILRVHNAVTDSLGMLSSVAQELGSPSGSDPLDEVLEYLAAFRILLILDNLETVLDERIKRFLAKTPAGSKVLITSRIGIGTLEFPIALGTLEDAEALALLRSLAKARNVSVLKALSKQRLGDYCARMRNNPAHIKWFVAAVQAGRRPEEVVADDALFLEFCMSNVYEYLSPDSQNIVRALQALGGRYTLAELAYLTGIEDDALRRAVQQLLLTNMLILVGSNAPGHAESGYEIAGLARSYLAKKHPLTREQQERFVAARQKLTLAEEAIGAEKNMAAMSAGSITIRSRSEAVVAKYLSEALFALNRRDYDKAADKVQRAKALAPGYFEVHRLDAMVKSEQRDIYGAYEAYLAAVDAEPEYAPLRAFFGGFLLRDKHDVDAAIVEFEKARSLDPNLIEAPFELARSYLWSHSFAKAANILDELRGNARLEGRTLRIYVDLQLQLSLRQADDAMSNDNAAGALHFLERAKELIEGAPPHTIDRLIRAKLERGENLSRAVVVELRDSELAIRALTLNKFFSSESTATQPERYGVSSGMRLTGTVVKLPPGGNAGVIKTPNGIQFYFVKSLLVHPNQWPDVTVGDFVEFTAVRDAASWFAKDVIASEAPTTASYRVGQKAQGVILRTTKYWGWIRGDPGPEINFHCTQVSNQSRRIPKPGTRVSFVPVLNYDGELIANEVTEV